ncbi:MAG: DUF6787 family protein [Flavobacteriaceae bacterium]
MNKLKKRWGITSNRQLIIIFIVFAITGSLATIVAKPLTILLGISPDYWLFWPLRILLIIPIYQLILVVIGWVFGEFDFFKNFVKKMFQRLTFR